MPITLPNLDDRTYQDLLEEAIARIPVHTPEWTNFNQSDPGITVLEVFAFLTESLLYRSNQIPERNRKKFLKLLNIGLRPATPARGLVQIRNEKAPLQVNTLDTDSEIAAGQVRFRTTRGLDVLPIEGRFFVKRTTTTDDPELIEYYKELYASFRGTAPSITPNLYSSEPFPAAESQTVKLSETVDKAIWLGLFARKEDTVSAAVDEIAGKVLTLGFVPVLTNASMELNPGQPFASGIANEFIVEAPRLDTTLLLPSDRIPRYQPLKTKAVSDLLAMPGVMDVTMPQKPQIGIWKDIDPLEGGTDEFPPPIDDPALEARLITWFRIRPAATASTSELRWIGINCVPVEQRTRIFGEVLPDGTGEPDQMVRLSQPPVVPGSVRITIAETGKPVRDWTEIEDLWNAGPEVPTPDPRLPAGAPLPTPTDPYVFLLNPEAGEVRFGDGLHGARPRLGGRLRASYDYSEGAQGNVGAKQVNKLLEGGVGDLVVENPIPTWGGIDSETVEEGEKQISRYLKNRDRLVTFEDFEEITLRTPGVNIARVDVLPNYHPGLSGNSRGDVPGVVTILVVPADDPQQPDAPRPDRLFLSTICSWLDQRRVLTTELFLRGPDYRGLWISLGIKSEAGRNEGVVREAVKQAVTQFLSPVAGKQKLSDEPRPVITDRPIESGYHGWPLLKPVIDLELAAVAGRVSGVEFVQQVLIATEDGSPRSSIAFEGLELPRILGISMTVGNAVPIDTLRGASTGTGTGTGTGTQGPRFVQIPVIPEVCR